MVAILAALFAGVLLGFGLYALLFLPRTPTMPTMPRVAYDSEDEAEQDLDAYMNHYHGEASSAAVQYGPDGVHVEYSHPWPVDDDPSL